MKGKDGNWKLSDWGFVTELFDECMGMESGCQIGLPAYRACELNLYSST